MEMFFNELCIKDAEKLRYADIMQLGEVHRELYKYGINICRISYAEQQRIMHLAAELQDKNHKVNDFLYGFFRQPYESAEIEGKQDDYLQHKWTCNGEESFGLALACIMDSMSLSMINESWDIPFADVNRDEEMIKVRNVFGLDTINVHREWLDQKQPIVLVKCGISPDKKMCDLRDDHGKKELNEFSMRILKNEYVIEVVNSLPFNAHNRRFIHRIRENGLIEIVLPWTDEGYGLIVRTTGRNMRETKAIAELLRDEFGML